MFAVLLLALLASAAAMSFSKPLRATRAQDAVELIRSFDDSARQTARRLGHPVQLRFDLPTARLARLEGERLTYQSPLPHGVRIAQVRTAARRALDGQIEIACSPQGLTRTYAVRLVGAGSDQWLLVSGFSGHVAAIKDEAQLDAIFQSTASRAEAITGRDPPGDDAD